MNDHTPKPIDPEKFFRTLQRWIGGRPKAPEAGHGHQVGDGVAPDNGKPHGPEVSGRQEDIPDSLPGINLEAALKLVAGNKRLLRNILLEFTGSFRGADEEISSLIGQGKVADACRLVHNIKGTSGNIGAQGLQQAAVELEKRLKENGGGKTGEAMRAFRNELAQVLTVSRVLLPLKKENDPGMGGNAAACSLTADEVEKLKALFGQLEDMIRQNSFDAADFFEENIKRDGAKGFLPLASGEMESLGKALDSFDFEGALRYLRAAVGKLDPGDTGDTGEA